MKAFKRSIVKKKEGKNTQLNKFNRKITTHIHIYLYISTKNTNCTRNLYRYENVYEFLCFI